VSSVDLVSAAEEGAWDERRPPDPELIRDCVHCGFCLPTCPSYMVFEEEMDSPRGRIVLMRVGHEAGAEVSKEMATHFDRCLGCMACVTACPSGVQYDRLIEQTRPQVERHTDRPLAQRAFRRAIFELFTHPGRLRATVPLLAAQRRLGLTERLAGSPLLRRAPQLRAAIGLSPDVPVRAAVHRLAQVTKPRGASRGRIALMQGCVQRVFFGDVNAATVRVLAAEGFEVHAPRQPRCCGALQLHSGLEDEALERAKETIAAYEDFDAIAVNVAGCGSAMKDYAHLLEDDPEWGERAVAFSAKVSDVTELLAEHEPRIVRHPLELKVAYHDACHLAHAQGVREPPRELLRAIPGLELVEPAEWEICCGSAGIYNLLQPKAAAELGRRKVANLTATGAEAIAAGNPGCAMQIIAHMEPAERLPVYHPLTLLDWSLRNARPG
jgi:glycolate oxidase iron-sulfur subunit